VSTTNEPIDKFRGLTRSVSAGLSTLRTSTPEVMKSFNELGRAATSDGTLDAKTKELIALALSVAARCDPCIGFHMQTLVKLGATRQEIDETLGVTTYMGGGPSLMYAANAIAAFDEFSRSAVARTA
jgi:AhpD family alkylhydroperoxidase